MREIKFSKMQGLGNDFVLLNAIDNPMASLATDEIKRLADRRLGIGADQILLLSKDSDDTFKYQIWNTDGNEVAQCGNGARSAYLYLTTNKYASGLIKLRTSAGIIDVEEGTDGPRAYLGVPQFEAKDIPLNLEKKNDEYVINYKGESLKFYSLSIGNPHAIFMNQYTKKFPLDEIGEYLNQRNEFPQGVNVSYVITTTKTEFALKVYERGVGQTPACGSAAAAVSVINYCQSSTQETLIHLQGGQLRAGWDGHNKAWIEGKVEFVFDGTITL